MTTTSSRSEPAAPRVAVIGSGPSGVFATAHLLGVPGLEVDVFDRLPTPFGLVRYGVAPDHLKIKAVARSLTKVLADPRVLFVGNVDIGRDVSIDALRSAYDAVLVATGAPSSRTLGIPGEHLPGSHAAGDLVSWYNGHPDAELALDAPTPAVAIVGAGNVSLDVARVLLKAGTGLASTDVPTGVQQILTGLGVRDVHIIVRRGVEDVRFSLVELMELDKLEDVDIIVASGLEQPGSSEGDPEDRATAMRTDLFRRWSRQAPQARPKRLHFHFRSTPIAITGNDSVEAIRLDTTGEPGPRDLAVQAVVRAIGYRGRAIPGMPFDVERGVVPHDRGVVDDDLFVTGWIKRGPSGVIGTNKACAVETVDQLLDRLSRRPTGESAERRNALLRSLGDQFRVVDWTGWQAIDEAEIALGSELGRPRTKIADRDALVDIGSSRSRRARTTTPKEARL